MKRCNRSVLALLSVVAMLGVFATAASAADFTWTGGDTASPQPNWSDGANWSGGIAPASGSTIGTLDFPALTSADCTSATPVGTCQTSEDDVSNVTVDELDIATDHNVIDSSPSTNGITLDGGLSLLEGGNGIGAEVNTPITLGAANTWYLDANAAATGLSQPLLLLGSPLSGDEPLTVDLANDDLLYLIGDNEIGPVVLAGENVSQGCANGGVLLDPGSKLNATSGNPIMLSHAAFTAGGSVGPLSSVGSCIWASQRLSVPSATFDAHSTLGFTITGSGSTPGTDYSQLTSTGPINLGGATLQIQDENGTGCGAPPEGQPETIISTTGALTGTFGNVGNGGMIEELCDGRVYLINFNTTGSPKTVTATLIATPTTISLAIGPQNPVTNQTVTLITHILPSSSSTGAAGTVAFEENGVTIPGCAAQPVIPFGGAVSTCQTSFAAQSSPVALQAIFTPAAGSVVAGSTITGSMVVAKDSTRTALAVPSAAPTAGASLTYRATVTPTHEGAVSPSGSVEFLANGRPIVPCAGKPLRTSGTSSVASCTVSARYLTSSQAIAAKYLGNTNFAASTSPPALEKPILSRASIHGVAKRDARLALTATAGRDAPALRTIMIEPPEGIDFLTGQGISATGAKGKHLRLKTNIKGAGLAITLPAGTFEVHIAVTSPAIDVSDRLALSVAERKTRSVTFRVILTDVRHAKTELGLTLTT